MRRLAALAALTLLFAGTARAQDLSPALAGRFANGVKALEAGRVADAEREFRHVLDAGGRYAFVHHNLGIALQRQGRHEDALAQFTAAIALDPKAGPSHLLAGASLLALGRAREAARMLERAVDLMPAEPAAHLQLADACERLDDVACLVREYRTLASLAPDEPEYAWRLGKAYLRRSQRSFERIQAVDPTSARLQQALGGEYLAQGRLALAVQAFEEAARRDPALPGIHLELARIHLDQGRWDEAAREVERELAVAPESRDARALQAHILASRPRR